MILPWSHDSSQLRRRPWVTYTLAASCLVVFLGTTGLRQDPALEQAHQVLLEGWLYWQEHPYLDPPERVAATFGGLSPDAAAALEQRRTAGGGQLDVPAAVLIGEQAKLDALAAEADRVLQQHVWFRHGLVPAKPTASGLLGHLFLHAGWLHLLGNLWFLLLVGPFLEDRWGRGIFLLFYLASGLAAAALFVAMQPDFQGPLVGASGAISGLLGAFLVRCRRTNIRFFYWLGFFIGNFTAPAWVMVPLWFGSELVSALSDSGGAGGVAYWAHVGGFGFGVAAAWLIGRAGFERQVAVALGELGEVPEGGALAAARAAIRNGEPRAAFTQLREAVKAEPGASGQVAGLLEAARAAGCEQELPGVLGPALAAAVAAGSRSAALEAWRGLEGRADAALLDADAWLRLAGWLREAGERGGVSQALHQALRHASPEAALRIARLARRGDPVVALRASDAALTAPALSEPDRAALAALHAEAEREVRNRGIIVLPQGVTVERRRAGAAADPFAARALEVPGLVDEGTASPASDAASPGLSDEIDLSVDEAEALDLGGELEGLLEAEGLSEEDLREELDAPQPVAPADAGYDATVAPTRGGLFGAAGPEGLAGPDDEMPAAREERPPPLPAASAAPPPPPAVPLTPEPAEDPYARTYVAAAAPADSGPLGLTDAFAVDEEKEPAQPPLRPLRLVEAVPLALEEAHLVLDVPARGRSRIALSRIEAVAVAGVNGLSDRGKAVLVIDLVTHWAHGDELHVVRLRSDRFDPRRLLGLQGSPLQAVRTLAARLRTRARAVALPETDDPQAPFRIFADLASYEREVLRARGQ